MDHTHILQGGNKLWSELRLVDYVKEAKNVFGGRYILFGNEFGNKNHPSRQTVWWLSRSCLLCGSKVSKFIDNISACFCHSRHACKFYGVNILDFATTFWFNTTNCITQYTWHCANGKSPHPSYHFYKFCHFEHLQHLFLYEKSSLSTKSGLDKSLQPRSQLCEAVLWLKCWHQPTKKLKITVI